jgi:hypothetical protein
MRRRKLAATAGILSATAFVATLAIGANIGLVGEAEPKSPVGRLGDRRQVPSASAADAGPSVAVTTPAFGAHADD